MKKILFLCPHPLNCAAGQRLKFEPHFKYFQDSGFEIEVESFMTQRLWDIAYLDGHLLEKTFLTLIAFIKRFFKLFFLKKYDAVYIFMYVVPFGPSFFERITCLVSKKIIYDIEDNLLEQDNNDKRLIKRIFNSNLRYQYLIKKADHIVTSTQSLAEDCMKISEKLNATCILPTLSKTRFKPRESNAKTSQTVVLGWTGTFSSKKYLELIIPQLESLSKKVDFKLLVIGNFSFSHAFLNIEVLQWSEAEEISQLHRIDIGLYPLPNDKWITGKSGLKTLQYMAIGLPSVSSKYGNINNIISHEIDGFLVENNEEWIERLEQLILDQSYRKLMGKNAKRKFDSCFSQDINQKKYLDILETVT